MKQQTSDYRVVSEFTVDLMDELNAHPIIGPQAPGDGDIIQWHVIAVYIIASEFAQTYPAPDRDFVFDFDFPSRSASEPWGRWFRKRLRAAADSFIFSVYGPLNADQRLLWNDLYEGLIAFSISTYWGGRKIRVPMRRKVSDPQVQIEAALREGSTFADAFKRAGVSRATGYRILNKKSKT